MSKIKIFNDPIYGLVSYPYEFLYDIIDHPYLQRLRRIQQLGMSSIVYPGATHSRFHHALGALHLGNRLINNLRLKGVAISDHEAEATLAAILLHDIGHGPYSHALEHMLIPEHHESITLRIMNRLNREFSGRLDLAIEIFTNQYPRKFLHQIISGQLDVDRMDYLNRDSFYTGVAEGIIGYDRIIKMMNVVNDQLVVEEKGIHSVEKFLLSRYFMYHQVYLHLAALSADHMLKSFFKEYKLYLQSSTVPSEGSLPRLIHPNSDLSPSEQLETFLEIDDSDIIFTIKQFVHSEDPTLRILSTGLINRKLFRVITRPDSSNLPDLEEIINKVSREYGISQDKARNLVNTGNEQSALYKSTDEIKILRKDSSIVTLGMVSRLNLHQGNTQLHFLTYPKVIVA